MKKVIKVILRLILASIIIVLILAGVLIYLLHDLNLSECAFQPIDQNIVLDTLEADGVDYTLVYSGGGSWQDKVFYFKLYAGPVKFDECGNENIQPIDLIYDEFESSKCNKSIRLKERKIEIINANEGEQCTSSREMKFQH